MRERAKWLRVDPQEQADRDVKNRCHLGKDMRVVCAACTSTFHWDTQVKVYSRKMETQIKNLVSCYFKKSNLKCCCLLTGYKLTEKSV